MASPQSKADVEASYTDAPFGSFAPSTVNEAFRALGSRLPPGYVGRKGASLLLGPAGGRSGRPVDCTLFGSQRARLHPHDNICEKRVFIAPQLWDAAERAELAKLIGSRAREQPFWFADIGANVGLYTLFARSAGEAVGRKVKALCVEPDPDMIRRLTFNLKQSGALSDVVVAPFAATDTARILRFHIDLHSRGGSKVDRAGEISVEGKPLIQLVNEAGLPKIDAMKLDIEGHEETALAPFLKAADADLLPTLIILETDRSARSSPAVDLLAAHGYEPQLRTRMNTVLKRQR